MEALTPSTDEQLLEALAQRLEERRAAQEQSARAALELRVLNTRLESAERLKSQFLSNIRNEINNPLTAMRGFAAAIAENPALSPEQVHDMAVTMHREVSALAFQMQNIFAAADLESGVLRPDWSRGNVRAVVAECIADLRREAARRGVTVALEAPEMLVAIMDESLLSLMVSNLIANAITFSPENSRVEVSLRGDAAALQIEVRDEGDGIALRDVERIFDRFVQLSTGTTKVHPGHGLGLSVVRACADLLEGTVEVSRAAGGGALFRLVLPRRRDTEPTEPLHLADVDLLEVTETY